MVVIKHVLMWMGRIHAVAERDICYKLMIKAVQVKHKILHQINRVLFIWFFNQTIYPLILHATFLWVLICNRLDKNALN